MGEKMTLRESVLAIPAREALLGGQRYKYVRLEEVLGALDAHLTQPAQAVDVGAIREVIEGMRRFDYPLPPCRDFVREYADKLTAALPKDSNHGQ